jgi:hypothetical protein
MLSTDGMKNLGSLHQFRQNNHGSMRKQNRKDEYPESKTI